MGNMVYTFSNSQTTSIKKDKMKDKSQYILRVYNVLDDHSNLISQDIQPNWYIKPHSLKSE